MKKSRAIVILFSIFLMLSWMPIGCGGGGSGGSEPAPAPNLALNRTAYDFGNVTIGNTAKLQITISNTGTADLSVSAISLSNETNFGIDPNDCGTAPYTLAAGGECSPILTFTPSAQESYSETLSISSNDADASTYTATLTGSGTAVTELTVRLNQIETNCPTITAYVSVTDQDDFVVPGLLASDFVIYENAGTGFAPPSLDFAENASLSMAAAIVMDYSGSLVEVPDLVAALENSVIAFIDLMGAHDQGEIIKFAEFVEVIQPFTTDKNLLVAAASGLPDLGERTALYDAIYKGIEDAALTTTNRRAVIVYTDGVDWGGATGVPGSVHTKDEVIALAKANGVPVFTIGIGPEVDPIILQQLASETGGQFYDALSEDRIMTIYGQLSELLKSQYILTYTTPLSGTGSDVEVTVDVQDGAPEAGVVGGISNALTYTRCQPTP